MIETAWNEYRSWARRSRALQEDAGVWNRRAFQSAVLAAVLGAAASGCSTFATWVATTTSPALAATVAGVVAKLLAMLAAVAAGATLVLGRHLLETGDEAAWIRARATAEAIKSECFRFASASGDYADANARKKTFLDRRAALAEGATKAGLSALADDVGPNGDPRRPPEPMDAAWYLANRVQEQRGYYGRRQQEYEAQIGRLRTVSVVLALLGATLGAVAATLQVAALAPWIGVATTLGALLVAHGAMERRQYLAATYGAMHTALGEIPERFDGAAPNLAALVDATETLLQGEHAAWVVRLTRIVAAPAQAPDPPPDPPEQPPAAPPEPPH